MECKGSFFFSHGLFNTFFIGAYFHKREGDDFLIFLFFYFFYYLFYVYYCIFHIYCI